MTHGRLPEASAASKNDIQDDDTNNTPLVFSLFASLSCATQSLLLMHITRQGPVSTRLGRPEDDWILMELLPSHKTGDRDCILIHKCCFFPQMLLPLQAEINNQDQSVIFSSSLCDVTLKLEFVKLFGGYVECVESHLASLNSKCSFKTSCAVDVQFRVFGTVKVGSKVAHRFTAYTVSVGSKQWKEGARCDRMEHVASKKEGEALSQPISRIHKRMEEDRSKNFFLPTRRNHCRTKERNDAFSMWINANMNSSAGTQHIAGNNLRVFSKM